MIILNLIMIINVIIIINTLSLTRDGKTCRYCGYIRAIFSLAVLIFWLYKCKLAKKPVRYNYKHCAKGNMQKALC